MPTTVEAVYEAGVLRLLEPVALSEGARVQVTVVERNVTEPRPSKADTRTPAEILAEIAAMSVESGGEVFSGRDHDRILYGEKGAR